MNSSNLATLQHFRTSLHQHLPRRADALFDLIDANLTAGHALSLAHLSLEAAHQRGCGSLYAALSEGRINTTELRKLVSATLPALEQPVFAIDTSTWVRSDAETSPERGVYYHPSRHSAGKPIVAGWSYSWCAQLGQYSSSWTAPVDVARVPIEVDEHNVAGQQMRFVLDHLPENVVPLFAFDGGYDPMRLAEQVNQDEAAVLVRIRRNRCFYADPIHDPKPLGGRPRRHGAKFECSNPETWPAPTLEHEEVDERYGRVRVRAWSHLHAKTQNQSGKGNRQARPIVKGTVVLLEVSKLPRETRDPQAFWLWWRGLACRTSRSCGGRTSAGSTWSTPSASSRPP